MKGEKEMQRKFLEQARERPDQAAYWLGAELCLLLRGKFGGREPRRALIAGNVAMARQAGVQLPETAVEDFAALAEQIAKKGK